MFHFKHRSDELHDGYDTRVRDHLLESKVGPTKGGSKGGPRGHAPQTMDEKLKLSCRAHMLVQQLPLMTTRTHQEMR